MEMSIENSKNSKNSIQPENSIQWINKIQKVRKRTGEIVNFEESKIKAAIEKAASFLGSFPGFSEQVTDLVVKKLNERLAEFEDGIPNVEQIQDIVEETLFEKNDRIAKAYSLYRRSRHLAREIKQFLKLRDDLKFNATALKVLEERYLLKDEKGNIIETPRQMFERVAKAVAEAEAIEARHVKSKKERKRLREKAKQFEKEFFNMLVNLEFLPNSPTLMNAGTELGQLSACFVLPIEDSLDSIFTTLANMAKIQQSGGGTGFNFSKLRPQGDIVKSTKGVASGPVSFMKIYDMATEIIKQGGKRRGANMGILHVSHPDIEQFVQAKSDQKTLSNFNISVAVDDRFMNAVLSLGDYALINPRDKKKVKKINARELFEKICRNAWQTGDPGLIFIDEINRKHNLKIPIEGVNPCGEVPLVAYEACNLGSINLTKMVKEIGPGKYEFDWKKFERTIRLAVRFLDDVITINKFPIKEIEKNVKANRKIGLGVMGLADLFFILKIPYNSEEALKFSEKLASFLRKIAYDESHKLALEKGSFPNIAKSKHKRPMRNATLLSIAPTGTISIIAGCSSSIEPLFALVYEREILEGKRFLEINKYFLRELLVRGLYSDELIEKIAIQGNLKGIDLPKDLKELFVTALEIPYEQHIKMQAVWQKYIDNSVSKTINMPQEASIDDVKAAYLLAYKLKCKGITIYRYGSKPEQVLYLGESKARKKTLASLHFSHECLGSVCYL
ncbi:MAG: adenosylcobalamin-dependent ribonucleoside-diphosphate reductase [Candidatus Pacearchaeota archaeon]